jgi:hypothetical protein
MRGNWKNKATGQVIRVHGYVKSSVGDVVLSTGSYGARRHPIAEFREEWERVECIGRTQTVQPD